MSGQDETIINQNQAVHAPAKPKLYKQYLYGVAILTPVEPPKRKTSKQTPPRLPPNWKKIRHKVLSKILEKK